MGIKGRLGMVALGFAALGVITGCEPAPPPPAAAAAPTTPANLVSRAQYDAIVDGMSLEDVEWALGKRLTLFSESNSGTLSSRIYADTFEFGACTQSVYFGFQNYDVYSSDTLPFQLGNKAKYEYSCEGIIK
ncbi:MAG: hypothetical protein F2694_11425 [Actinobacteria bacterium]|nr:hypothetical protein [Actinomycetota bacterium]